MDAKIDTLRNQLVDFDDYTFVLSSSVYSDGREMHSVFSFDSIKTIRFTYDTTRAEVTGGKLFLLGEDEDAGYYSLTGPSAVRLVDYWRRFKRSGKATQEVRHA